MKPTRRDWLATTGLGAGAVALATLDADEHARAGPGDAGSVTGPHVRARAKNVIFLFMAGGPSHVDTFDPKPDLAKLEGRDVPESLARHVPRIQRAGLRNLMASPFRFARHGQSGLWVSDLLPETARLVDDLCVIRSMTHRNPVHGPAECVALTGSGVGDRPSMGAWLTYGLGSETRELPAFLVMNVNTIGMQHAQVAGWSAGFLSARHQGTVVEPHVGIRNVQMPSGTTDTSRGRQLDLIEWMNRRHLDGLGSHSELEARIRSYETAFRMQTAGPELFDLTPEGKGTRTLYGLDAKPTADVGAACLLARRMVERGVRVVQIRVGGWDAHGNLLGNHRKMAEMTDRPIAALLTDLKRRGLLDETLVVWGGEFGRTPTMEGRNKGRDHSPLGYTVWLAGGGIQGGQTIGTTDPIGYIPTKRPVEPCDLHATILHAMGLDQHRLSWNHHGRDEIATVNGGIVVHEAFV